MIYDAPLICPAMEGMPTHRSQRLWDCTEKSRRVKSIPHSQAELRTTERRAGGGGDGMTACISSDSHDREAAGRLEMSMMDQNGRGGGGRIGKWSRTLTVSPGLPPNPFQPISVFDGEIDELGGRGGALSLWKLSISNRI